MSDLFGRLRFNKAKRKISQCSVSLQRELERMKDIIGKKDFIRKKENKDIFLDLSAKKEKSKRSSEEIGFAVLKINRRVKRKKSLPTVNGEKEEEVVGILEGKEF